METIGRQNGPVVVETMKTIFIYGTLRKDGRLHSWMKHGEFLGEAVLPGVELFDLGNGVPGIYPGDGMVKGEVYLVTDAHFAELCYLEHGYVDTPVKIKYLDTNEEDDAIAFVWPDITKGYGTDRTPTKVESGDWMERTS